MAEELIRDITLLMGSKMLLLLARFLDTTILLNNRNARVKA